MTDSVKLAKDTEKTILRYPVPGARRFSNYVWGSLLCLGGVGFFLTGLSSYYKFPFSSTTIQFFPQGFVMCFYGFLAILLGVSIGLMMLWNVGDGFNEFNLKEGSVRIFRWGFPGKNRRLDLRYPIQDVQSIRVEIQEGINAKRLVYLKLRGNREIPLTGAGHPLSIQQIETQAAELAQFLHVSLESF